MAWEIVHQSPAEPEGTGTAREYLITLQDRSGQHVRVTIRAADGASLTASDAKATLEPHLDQSTLPDISSSVPTGRTISPDDRLRGHCELVQAVCLGLV